MKNEGINRIMPILVNISLALWGFGVLFHLQRWPYGNSISTFGLLAYLVLSQIEIKRLRKIIIKMQKEAIKDN
jgi:hypothetical protein